MKLFYGIVLVLMLFVSACAQQAAEEAPVTEPEATPQEEPEAEVEETGAAVAEEEAAEVTSNEVRYVGAGV